MRHKETSTISGPAYAGAASFPVIRAGNLCFSSVRHGEIQPRAHTTSLGANNGIAVNAVLTCHNKSRYNPAAPTS